MKNNSNEISTPAKQRGATLIVALVMLLVMGSLGASTMNTATLEERMANNARQKAIATAAAESALREAEQWLFSEVDSADAIIDHFLNTPTVGCYTDRELPILAAVNANRLSGSIPDLSEDSNWEQANVSRSIVDIDNSLATDNWSKDPRVVIELLGPTRAGFLRGSPGTAQSLDGGAQPSKLGPWVFRVTAIGWSKNPDIYSVLQTTYTTGKQFKG